VHSEFAFLLTAENYQLEIHIGFEGRDFSIAVHYLDVLA
jgi:hypothetical protein